MEREREGLYCLLMLNRYYSRWYRMGVVAATDHLMFVALVGPSNSIYMKAHTKTFQVLTWGNTVINYYQDQSSRKVRPSFFRRPVRSPRVVRHVCGTDPL